MDDKTPLVSVCCTCFNHERYIAKALQSFINQKTSFVYEIIINDDASTDSSAEIIRNFASNYPDLVFPIYQRENQYSRKVKIVQDIILPRARGRYIALCEGDDFWCDSQKLQIQFDYMENHPECLMCGHSNLEVDEKGKKITGIKRFSNHDTEIGLEPCFELPPAVHLSSYFIRKDLFYSFSERKKLCPVGDVSLCIEASSKYPIHYIDRVMSCYRVFSSSSWTRRMAKSPESRKLHFNRMIDYLTALGQDYPQYQEKLQYEISVIRIDEMIKDGNIDMFFNSLFYDSLSIFDKLKHRIKLQHQLVYSLLVAPRKVKRLVYKCYLNVKYRNKLL